MIVRKIAVSKKVRSNRNSNYSIPEINISGKWLQQAGFSIGDKVQINALDGKLLVVPVNDNSEEPTPYEVVACRHHFPALVGMSYDETSFLIQATPNGLKEKVHRTPEFLNSVQQAIQILGGDKPRCRVRIANELENK